MSGAETLIPFLRDKGKGDQPTIIIDSREAKTAPKIVKGLKELGADISTRHLEKGDYVISNLCAFERKTVRDFVYTLTRRYLFDQLFSLKECYEKPFILIEGYLPIVYKFSRIQPALCNKFINLLRKGNRRMAHAPFPFVRRQYQQRKLMLAVFLPAVQKRLVRTAVIGF